MQLATLLFLSSFLFQTGDSLFVFKKDGKYGYVNQRNEVIIQPQYDKGWFLTKPIINTDSTQYLSAQKDGKFGIIDLQENIIQPFQFDQRVNIDSDYIRTKKDGKFGYSDINGNMIIEAKFDTAAHFGKSQTALVGSNDKWGLINRAGEVILPYEYENFMDLLRGSISTEDAYLELIRKANKHGAINEKGEWIVPMEYDQLSIETIKDKITDNEGVRKTFKQQYIKAKKDGKYGLLNVRGETVLDVKYNRIQQFAGKFFVQLEDQYGLLKPDASVDFFAFKGVEVALSPLRIPYTHESLVMVKKGAKYGFFDANTLQLIEPEYDQVKPFSEGLSAVRKGDRWGFMDESGELVIPLQYERVRPFSEGKTGVQKDGLWGFIDQNGQEIISPQFLEVDDFDKGFAPVNTLPGKWVKTDQPTVSMMGDTLFYKKEIAEDAKNQWTYIDESGKLLTEGKYWDVKKFSQYGWANVKIIQKNKNSTKTKYGVLNAKGEEILAPISDHLVTAYNGLFIVESEAHDNKKGMTDGEGNWKIEPNYDGLCFSPNPNILMAFNDNKWSFLDLSAKEIFPPIIDKIKLGTYNKETVMDEPCLGCYWRVNNSGNRSACFGDNNVQLSINGKKALYDFQKGFLIPPSKILMIKEKYVYFEEGNEGGFLTPEGEYLGVDLPLLQEKIQEWNNQ